MPYVQIRTTQELSNETILTVKSELGAAISLIPGKGEKGLMMEFVTGCRIFLHGNEDAPAAYVSVLVNNDQKPEDLKAYSKKVLDVLSTHAGIPYDRIYVTHQSVPVWHSARAFGTT